MVLGFCSYSIHGSVRLRIEAPEEKPYLTRWRYTFRRDEENILIMAVAAYTFESKAKGTSKGRGKRRGFWLHVHLDTSKIPKRGAENTEKSIWEPSLS